MCQLELQVTSRHCDPFVRMLARPLTCLIRASDCKCDAMAQWTREETLARPEPLSEPATSRSILRHSRELVDLNDRVAAVLV
jgi:hypothetical protein